MAERIWRTVSNVRAGLAEVAALRWFRLGGFGLAVPVAAALTVAGFRHQLWNRVDLAFGLPFAGLWLGIAAVALATIAAARWVVPGTPGGRPWRGASLAAFVLSGWLVYDLWFWQASNQLYDLDVYLGSAGRWIAGGQPYLTGPISSWPLNPAADYFLYPPPFLPVFGLLSELPKPLVSAGWVAFLVICAYAAFRALGLRRSWSLALLAFPPVAIGFESGNVASLTFLLFVLGCRVGALLPLDGLFKAQLGLPALWLVRSGRWRAILGGLALVAAVAFLTLPLVGLDSWRDWIAGLDYRTQSQAAVAPLYGFSFARVLPAVGFAAVVVATVALALVFTGRRSLAAFGLATIVASPALWPHGFAFALPAVLMLENGALVLAILAAGAVGADTWLLFYGGWLAVLAAPRIPDALHPMAGTDGPWPRAAEGVAAASRRTEGGDGSANGVRSCPEWSAGIALRRARDARQSFGPS